MRWYEERRGSVFASEVLSKETLTQFRDYLQKTRGLKAPSIILKMEEKQKLELISKEIERCKIIDNCNVNFYIQILESIEEILKK